MKTFLSIGSGPGIGFATAERFAREGYRVVLSARDLSKTLVLAERLKGLGYEAHARRVDAVNSADVAELVAQTESQFGAVDVVHYNAAIIRQASIAEQALDSFNTDLAVNIGGALATAQSSLNSMANRNSGSILLTGGFFGVNPNPDFLSLSLGKAGIRALTLGLFEPAKAQGVHVATVTVAAFVQPESEEAAGIAEAFWQLHTQPQENWTAEVTYSR
ncbi:short-chain dehydrogenase [Pseudomonas fluorescens]|uniref:Short-chain dehydrogenase n=1 Tax=Pseudomonas fluorescens TaxID=294 RepID=A0A327MQQ0_PSEFL|nr:SDR family NAD(P)-dependent oxidoreductase [Pseudomonas fluorescens]RAI64782.1 short-chain dehydrogenase [Pseudomonas fluorescens]